MHLDRYVKTRKGQKKRYRAHFFSLIAHILATITQLREKILTANANIMRFHGIIQVLHDLAIAMGNTTKTLIILDEKSIVNFQNRLFLHELSPTFCKSVISTSIYG